MLTMTTRKEEFKPIPKKWMTAAIERRGEKKAAIKTAGSYVPLLLLLAAHMLGVQQAVAGEDAALRITLREAVQMALRQNPQVQIEDINIAQSEQDRNLARSALMPQLGAAISETAQRGNFEAFTGRTIPGFSKQIGPFQVFQAGVAFSVPLFDLALYRRWQASGLAVGAADARAQSVREQITLLVVSQYLGCLRAAADVRAGQSRVALSETLYRLAASLQENGVGTRIDTLRANVQLQNEKQRLIYSETQAKTSLFGLAQLLNLEPQKRVELADTVSFFETPRLETEQSFEKAYSNRSEMKALVARQQIIEKQRQAIRSERLPSLQGTGAWSYQGLSASNSMPVYQYQVKMSAPLFTGGRIKAEITKIDLEMKKTLQEQRELQNRIALQVRVALAGLEAARVEVEVSNLGLSLANEEVIQARDRFEAGVANNVEIVTAQNELARANDNQINALYRYNQARADLAHAMGHIEALYAK